MSKKVLDTKTVINELRGQSAYFRKDLQEDDSHREGSKIESKNDADEKSSRSQPDKVIKETTPPIKSPPKELHPEMKDDTLGGHAYEQASKHASMIDNNEDDLVKTIRKTVKQVGTKTLFIRLTPEEKHELSSIVYTFNELYRGESHKTSENEIGRIALNYLLEDYRTCGDESILAKVLAALIA